jgi:two-component system phosphate regulon sensor histidine kinase PhoR
MLKNRIWLIIILMSFALLGIILVQVYWIQNTITQKEQIFSYQVNEALNKVADKVETNIAASVLSNHMNTLFSDTVLSGTTDAADVYSNMLKDTVLTRVIQSARHGATYFEQTEIVSLSPLSNIEEPGRPMSERPTMILEPMEINGDLTSANSDLISQILKNIDKQIQINSQRLKKAMEQMMFEMMERGISSEQKVDTVFLKNILTHELSNRGISTDFNFGVLMNDNYFITNTSNKQDAKKLAATVHKVSLFPDDLFFNDDVLLVDFPNERNFILSSILSLLIGSIIFTAIIVIVFYYTIHILLRQKKLSEIKNDFINNMTHEFKTPLATISLAADAINNPSIIKDEHKVQHYSHIIKEENRRMNSQVEKVLQMALLGKNQISLSKDEIDIHEIIERTVENISILLEEGGFITTELLAETYEITGDEVHIMNVISNLLDNAIKYSPQKPQIKISTTNNKKGIFISVEDRGMGMSSEHIKMIFEKFYRVPSGNIHNVKGFGLGLAYVKAIVDAHNGSIDVKSQLNRGSEFRIFIPFSSAFKNLPD